MARVQRTKMLWYYSRIIDWMIAHPEGLLRDCAKFVGVTQPTLSVIINSDMFKAALDQRKREFQMHHDIGLVEKTTKIAHASLDAILETLVKKKDGVPIQDLKEISESALGRLGYGVKPAPQVSVHVGNNNTQVVLPVSQQDLLEAREALRTVQELKARQLPPLQDATQVLEAEPIVSHKQEDELASSPPND